LDSSGPRAQILDPGLSNVGPAQRAST
jgi:hypothetical protein